MDVVGAIARIGERAARVARKVVPDPYVIAIGLAAVVLLAAFAIGTKPPADVVTSFAFGFLEPANIAFAFQMVLVLMTGSAIAKAPVVERAIVRLAETPRTSAQAAALTALVAMTTSLFNWGLGLVVGALFAREIGKSFARRGLPLHYGVVGAAGFTGLAIWHGGLSGSAPLKVASAGPFGEPISVSATLFSPLNLITTSAVFVAFVLLFYALGSHDAPPSIPLPESSPPSTAQPEESGARVDALERSALVLACIGVPLAAGIAVALARKGASAITLDLVILAFLAIGFALHRSPAAYARAFASGAAEASGIVLQFPLYFGIIAVARDTGLVVELANAMSTVTAWLPLDASTAAPLTTYWSACAINMLVPSGGGQWIVQSPIILQLANELSLDRAPLVMAFSYGDETTNLLQPFWALPLLSITGLRAKDIMGFTMVATCVEVAIITLSLLVLA